MVHHQVCLDNFVRVQILESKRGPVQHQVPSSTEEVRRSKLTHASSVLAREAGVCGTAVAKASALGFVWTSTGLHGKHCLGSTRSRCQTVWASRLFTLLPSWRRLRDFRHAAEVFTMRMPVFLGRPSQSATQKLRRSADPSVPVSSLNGLPGPHL